MGLLLIGQLHSTQLHCFRLNPLKCRDLVLFSDHLMFACTISEVEEWGSIEKLVRSKFQTGHTAEVVHCF